MVHNPPTETYFNLLVRVLFFSSPENRYFSQKNPFPYESHIIEFVHLISAFILGKITRNLWNWNYSECLISQGRLNTNKDSWIQPSVCSKGHLFQNNWPIQKRWTVLSPYKKLLKKHHSKTETQNLKILLNVALY